MAYLLVCRGDALETQSYGISLVWINPNQIWASTMEEAVRTLSAYISNRHNWPYALAQLYEGSSHITLPKDKHLGILPQGKVEESSYGVDQAAQNLPAMSSLSHRFEWGGQTNYNHSTRTTKQMSIHT